MDPVRVRETRRVIALTPSGPLPQVVFVTARVGWNVAGLASGTSALRTTDGGRHWTKVVVPF